MPITKINSYDPDEVFKQKCNENFSDINARVDSRSGSVLEQAYPVGSVILTTNDKSDQRFSVGQWQKLLVDVGQGVYMYERIA